MTSIKKSFNVNVNIFKVQLKKNIYVTIVFINHVNRSFYTLIRIICFVNIILKIIVSNWSLMKELRKSFKLEFTQIRHRIFDF